MSKIIELNQVEINYVGGGISNETASVVLSFSMGVIIGSFLRFALEDFFAKKNIFDDFGSCAFMLGLVFVSGVFIGKRFDSDIIVSGLTTTATTIAIVTYGFYKLKRSKES